MEGVAGGVVEGAEGETVERAEAAGSDSTAGDETAGSG